MRDMAFYSLSFLDYAGQLIQVASAYAQDDRAARLLSLHFDFFDVAELKIVEGARLVFQGPVSQVIPVPV
jgi:hypothetical protein